MADMVVDIRIKYVLLRLGPAVAHASSWSGVATEVVRTLKLFLALAAACSCIARPRIRRFSETTSPRASRLNGRVRNNNITKMIVMRDASVFSYDVAEQTECRP